MDPIAEPTGPRVEPEDAVKADGNPVEALLTLLRTKSPPPTERRRVQRKQSRATGSIRAVGITPANSAEPVFICDANDWGIGFFTRGAIVSGAEATATVVWPDGRIVGVDGYIARCRQVRDGWTHSALVFFQPQPMLQYLM